MNNIVTFKDFKRDYDFYKNSIEEIQYDILKFLWCDDYYDGMLCGMLVYKSNQYRFEIASDIYSYQRYFAIILLTENQIEQETNWNKLFVKHVGNHNNFNLDETYRLNPQSEHHLFYDEYNKREIPNYESNIVIGWYKI